MIAPTTICPTMNNPMAAMSAVNAPAKYQIGEYPLVPLLFNLSQSIICSQSQEHQPEVKTLGWASVPE